MMTIAVMLMSSCGSYEATGAYTGAHFGSIIGSVVGGVTGGWRGSDVGALVGMAGGAAVGAAVGRAADNRAQQQYEDRVNRRYDRDGYSQRDYADDWQGDINRREYRSSVSNAVLEIRNARLLDSSRDGIIARNEEARMVFEIYNNSAQTAFHVMPSVSEVSGNKHIRISENVLIESIQPYQTIRYTATVKADNRLRDGEAVIQIGLFQGASEIGSQSRTFRMRTSR